MTIVSARLTRAPGGASVSGWPAPAAVAWASRVIRPGCPIRRDACNPRSRGYGPVWGGGGPMLAGATEVTYMTAQDNGDGPLRIAMLAPPWIPVPAPAYGGIEEEIGRASCRERV